MQPGQSPSSLSLLSFASLCVLPAVACSDDDHGEDENDDVPSVVCTLESRTSVIVSLTDATGEPVTDASVSYSVGAEPSQLCLGLPDGTYSCGREQAGSFIITATRGSESVSQSIVVARDQCHV